MHKIQSVPDDQYLPKWITHGIAAAVLVILGVLLCSLLCSLTD